MKVLKFGGTSVASAENIQLVKEIIQGTVGQGSSVVVVSAFGSITDLLLNAGEAAASGDPNYEAQLKAIEEKHISISKALLEVTLQGKTLSKVKLLLNDMEDICRGIFLIKELSTKTQDTLMSYGERLSSLIISDYIRQEGIPTLLADPRELIVTDENYGSANVHFKESYQRIRDFAGNTFGLILSPGFVAGTETGELITLGRGGSDYTAALFAAALDAEALEIWTDVSGMMTADPRWVSSAHAIAQLSYEEAMELSHFGAKVLYPPTIQPAMEKHIPIWIKNTFAPKDHGTLISKVRNGKDQLIKGLSCIKNTALLNLSGSGMVGIPNFSNRLFKALSYAGVNVILITQASSEHSICIAIDESNAAKAEKAVNEEFALEIEQHKVNPVEVEDKLSIIALVGSNMRDQVGVSGKMLSTLAHNGVNIKAIAQGSSERNISTVINQKHISKALNSLHESFFLSERKTINLFMIGVGNVGGALIAQLQQQRDYLLQEHHIDLKIVGLANSRKMYFDANGLNTENWMDTLMQNGEDMEVEKYIDTMKDMNLRNSVFIDNTDSHDIAALYESILASSISVVTPNKVACSSNYDNYLTLKRTAQKYGAKFLYETNVGAGLPILSTLSDLIKSGDKVTKIQAVLSGSLNFIFNNFNEETRFVDVVRQAKEEGYTEPDPRVDLSGVDVMRKILILIRDSGEAMDLEDIQGEPFIPESCMQAESVDAFMKGLEEYEPHFQKLYATASNAGKKLKYVAAYDKGKASGGLKEIEEGHPFHNLEGKDNIVLFFTHRYTEQPLVVKGAGAGADVTASGIFADIMKIANG